MITFIRAIIPYMWLLSIVIIGLAVWGYKYIQNVKANGTQHLISKRRWIEMIPSGISTLGVLGTFLGITLGLLCFDASNLTQSIPELLDGLKTAFFTSLAGMFGNLWLSRTVNNVYDEAEGGVSDINQAAGVIVKSVSTFQQQATQQAQTQQVFYNLMQTLIQQMDANIAQMNANVSSLNVAANNVALKIDGVADNINTVATKIDGVATATTATAASAVLIKDGIEGIKESSESISASVGNLEESNKSQADTANHIDDRIGELMTHTEAMVSTEEEVSDKITNLTDKLHGEVIDIEDKMAETSKLLERKFDEFSELLKKNNTEALVEVMKRVTEEFQQQMNALISKLVQENFDQLNKSVEKLNQWQQENKQMIASLTAQYKQMAENFENTSTSLTKVKEDTRLLVSDGGKLEKLINSLNEVIVQDEKFKAISSDLQKTADLSKSNMESFDQSTRQLNDWVKKQRNFSDAVAVLIKKLEELNEMRNYASTFWKDTKQGMNDAVNIVKGGTSELNQQIVGLNQQFYARLSSTLSELDACIRAIIDNSANNRR